MTTYDDHVFVPTKVDAYVNYTSPFGVEYDPPRPNPVYLAHIPQPNFAALRLESHLIQHDIFEDVREPPLLASADRYRVLDRRGGIYLHWSLPRPYRVGIAASDGYTDLNAEKVKGGYASTDDQALDNGTAVFRQVPNRWIIRRVIRTTGDLDTHGSAQSMVIRQGTQEEDYYWEQQPDSTRTSKSDFYDGLGVRKTVFVVESDQTRQIDDIPVTEDIEITSSPVVDYKAPLNQQGQTLLGRSYTLQDWPGSSATGTKYASSLTVVRTANPYFADFQPQNGGVFSFFDDLSVTYRGSQWQLANANISYSVIGYYAHPERSDPLAMPLAKGQSNNDRLAACQMALKSSAGLDSALQSRLAAVDQPLRLRTICSGSFNGIYWNIRGQGRNVRKAKVTFPGDVVQNAFNMSHPLAVGTNALDALYAWLALDTSLPKDVQAQLMRLQSYVLDINDDLDSQLQAEDLLATNNFVPTASGSRYSFISPNAALPDDLQNLIRRNAQQSRYDALIRQYDRFKTDMFYLWWTFIADQGKDTVATNEILRDAVRTLRAKMANNVSIRKGAWYTAAPVTFTENIQASAETSFYMQRDPTVLIAGMKNAWPQNLGEKVNVRLQEQLHAIKPPPNPEYQQNYNILNTLSKKIEADMIDPITRCWEECDRLTGLDNLYQTYWTPESVVLPDYYGADMSWSSTNNNGWFPLFVEWAVEFYDIPWQHWEFAPYGPEGRLGYRIRNGVDLAGLNLTDDYLVIKGRSPILPQASGALETALKQVLAKVNPDVLANQVTMNLDDLTTAIRKMDYLSTTMSGLTDQLVTRMSGTHVTPLTYANGGGKASVPPDILEKASEAIGMTTDDFLVMSSGSSTTPFASLTPVTSDTKKYSPFKPVTHGQFRFTKLNIIDKFGQMIQGIRLTNDVLTSGGHMNDDRNHIAQTPLFPCLGEIYSLEECTSSPDLKGLANAVLRRADGLCSFVQIPPSINQPARLNADFVTPIAAGSSEWRRLEEHENPCRGYLVINYANASFQVFTRDGQFVREYSVRTAKIVTMPFAPNAALVSGLDPLLFELLQKFSSTDYLVRLFQNISTTVEAVQANPSHYAESMLSLLGRPLALVTFGISLELEGPPLFNRSTIRLDKPPTPTDSVTGYDFKVKIGDGDNVFDGLYGFFNSNQNKTDFNLDTFFSYHDPDPAKQPQFATLNPFYVDPMDNSIDPLNNGYTSLRNRQYKVYAALMDPFSPIHCYTAILPVKQLTIPPWALQQGVDRIASFFRMGPILSPKDVPAFNPKAAIAEDYRLDDPRIPKPTDSIPIPAVSVADWRWLQPYWQSTDGQTGKTMYNLLDIETVGQKPKYEQPPYVVTEGYLQMKKSFVAPDTALGPI